MSYQIQITDKQIAPASGARNEGSGGRGVQHGVDDDERQALRADGLDPDDPAVIAAMDLVR
jgi:hypothetical protein